MGLVNTTAPLKRNTMNNSKVGAPVGNKNRVKSPSEKRVARSLRLLPETIATMKRYSEEQNISMAKVVDLAVKMMGG